MKICKISQYQNFKKSEQNTNGQNKNPEFIDKLLGKIKNPRDVSDCVAVPRGIFKAYMFIMGGSALLGISSILPQKLKKTKIFLSIAGTILNFISAIFFSKGFIIKNLSPTINASDSHEKLQNKSSKQN